MLEKLRHLVYDVAHQSKLPMLSNFPEETFHLTSNAYRNILYLVYIFRVDYLVDSTYHQNSSTIRCARLGR